MAGINIFNISGFKKYLSIFLIVLIVFSYVVSPVLSYAQTVTPTDTPTPTTTDNTATTTTTSDTTSNTGDNSIGTSPTPTIDPSLTPTDTPTPTVDPSLITPTDTPTPDPSTVTPTSDPSTVTPTPSVPDGANVSNNANVSDNSISSANTGDNAVIATDSSSLNNPDNSCQPSQGGGSINTGNAVSTTAVDNSINSTSLNSQVVYQTINLFVDSSGDINLSDPFKIAAAVIPQHPDDSTINVNVTNVNNYAYLNNNVVSYANTGNNTINGSGGTAGVINTGDAYSLVSLLNKVNFTIINSAVHIVTINIFGNLNGNIILPDLTTASSCATCGISLDASNSATVTNNVNSQAISGQNDINGSGSIATGNANSMVNLLNLINSNFSGVNINGLFINVLGVWDGSFIGWGDMTAETGGASLNLYETGPPSASGNIASGDVANITNNAIVNNNVTSTANTGGNTINGKGTITTGNAFSLVSIINFINTNFINSSGFFGFLNIFGNWTGNIGGKSQFAALNTQNNDSNTPPPLNISNDSATNTDSNTIQDQGGQLSVENLNNVSAFVYPGDTVTFFLKVRNTGTGKVYGTKLNLTLMHSGQALGTASFSLNDIDGGKGIKVTTGIVIPKSALPGVYTAVASVTGNVGPDNNSVSANADSNFTVFGNTIATATNFNDKTPITSVLGTTNNKYNISTKNSSENAFYLTLIILLTFAYVSIRLIRKREYVFEVISSPSFKEKLVSIRMFMF